MPIAKYVDHMAGLASVLVVFLALHQSSNAEPIPYTVSLTADGTKLHLSDKIPLQVTIKNSSRESIDIDTSVPTEELALIFLRPIGGPATKPTKYYAQFLHRSDAYFASYSTWPLSPGETRMDTVDDLRKLYDIKKTGLYQIWVFYDGTVSKPIKVEIEP